MSYRSLRTTGASRERSVECPRMSKAQAKVPLGSLLLAPTGRLCTRSPPNSTALHRHRRLAPSRSNARAGAAAPSTQYDAFVSPHRTTVATLNASEHAISRLLEEPLALRQICATCVSRLRMSMSTKGEFPLVPSDYYADIHHAVKGAIAWCTNLLLFDHSRSEASLAVCSAELHSRWR